jgi:hypothetical protein
MMALFSLYHSELPLRTGNSHTFFWFEAIEAIYTANLTYQPTRNYDWNNDFVPRKFY